MIPIRMTIFFFPKTLRPKSFQKRSILWFSDPTDVELQKFTSGLNAVRLTMVFGPEACVIQLVWTTCPNCLFRPKVMVHLQVVRNIESAPKVPFKHKVMREMKWIKSAPANICPSEIREYGLFQSTKIIVNVTASICRPFIVGQD